MRVSISGVVDCFLNGYIPLRESFQCEQRSYRTSGPYRPVAPPAPRQDVLRSASCRNCARREAAPACQSARIAPEIPRDCEPLFLRSSTSPREQHPVYTMLDRAGGSHGHTDICVAFCPGHRLRCVNSKRNIDQLGPFTPLTRKHRLATPVAADPSHQQRVPDTLGQVRACRIVQFFETIHSKRHRHRERARDD